ncbi:cytochrome c-type biogenesis protein CcmH [Phytoactinopolyspora halotolerans]|uniref:Cytochrome c-type biogenesis protein n=1 Tax=Phytoactinopolyspora halotolerans TaxID=1981512 RepID=A0A6L9S9V0_9ACTN|nr:cytochrome c-type biogenesis protein CcmH [Phytoactinopolyspora halotolerans]NEE02016.1 tetratricopeptide repeat protein [Phytoactinopolyspora halotolerans]
MRRWLAWAGMLAAIAFAVFGLWSAAAAQRTTPADDVRSVATTLRCPTCTAESVADSTAPMATSMRTTVEEKLAAGESPDEIRAWFVERYGQQVLLQPPQHGIGLALWLLPLVVAPATAWLVVRARGGGRPARWLAGGAACTIVVGAWFAFEHDQWGADRAAAAAPVADPVGALGRAVEETPGDVELRLALGRALGDSGRHVEAAEHLQAATRLEPRNPSALYLTAFSLARADRQADAEPLLERLLDVAPEHAEGLLLLGTIRHQQGDPAGDELLRRFLEVAPDHPAADQAESMVNGDERG